MKNVPTILNTPDGQFIDAGYEGTTLPACKFGAGLKTREYHLSGSGDSVRLYLLEDGRYFIA